MPDIDRALTFIGRMKVGSVWSREIPESFRNALLADLEILRKILEEEA